MGKSRAPSTSAGTRFLKLGALTSRLGSSYVGHKVRGALSDAEARARDLAQTHARNALRVVSTLGELKGAAMKVGQMLSLQEDLLPAEMREALRGLQKSAPPVGFDRMRPVLVNELGDRYKLIARVEEQPHASASIGQVHRAQLVDGRQIVLKIQYPGIERMVSADLNNVRILARAFGALTSSKADFGEIAGELAARLTEELDYRLEAGNMRTLGGLLGTDEGFVVPEPIEELCTQRVLAAEYVPGLSADELVSERFPQELRDHFGEVLVRGLLRQVFEFRQLHADPNLANFAFTEDGRVIVYDFGCVKRFEEPFVEALRQIALDAWRCRYERLVADVEAAGFIDRGKKRVPPEVYRAYADAAFEQWRSPGLYDFGASPLIDRVMALHRVHWHSAFSFEVPHDMVFLGRTLGGTFGNLRRLGARVGMYELIRRWVAREKG
ncbi:MAG: AarF/ABC1/UbiB kinase family protein [Polyangiaceae bacterium]|nr:AarF/ABC1/UbiB kinase family protein [Polyangiaceae bacterium]